MVYGEEFNDGHIQTNLCVPEMSFEHTPQCPHPHGDMHLSASALYCPCIFFLKEVESQEMCFFQNGLIGWIVK